MHIEHVQPSRCREEFLERCKSNDIRKAEAKARGETINLKHQPAGPRSGFVLDSSTLEAVTPWLFTALQSTS
jgi:large subunit ribosomal protein L21e